MNSTNVVTGVLFFTNFGVNFDPIGHVIYDDNFGYIYKFPVHRFIDIIQETIFFVLSKCSRFMESVQLVSRVYKSKLFIKLRSMCSVSTNDLVNNFSNIPIHKGEFYM